jgi:hypothetical protein
MPSDDLLGYAKANGFSDAEMAAQLVALAQAGMGGNADAKDRRLAACAISHLELFGGEAEKEFVREAMRKMGDETIRSAAFRTGVRLAPGEWEEWLREVAADKRSETQERYLAYEEIVRLGQNADETTRQRVIEVLNEMREKDSYSANRNCLGRWVAELKGGDAWEAWLREVLEGKGFHDADRRDACALAIRVGRNGDAKTRQHVIEVLEKLCNDESLDVDRNALRRWIAELEKLP